MSGWITKWNFRDRTIICVPPPEGYPPSLFRRDHKGVSVVPGIRLAGYIFQVNLGGILYHSNTVDRAFLKYPFNGSHRFKPSFMIALGEEDIYLYAGFLNSLPLYS